MGVGPNYVLDKGFLLTGSAAFVRGFAVKQSATANAVALITAANAAVIGIVQDDVDAAKVATGKAVGDIRILGISRVVAGAAVAIGDNVATDNQGRAVTKAQTAGGSQPTPVFGIALTACTVAGAEIDVLLTPGRVF